MARRRGQKALYEVMGKSRSKSRNLQPLCPVKSPKRPKTEPSQPQQVEAKGIENRWLKPRPLQFNAGQVELTIAYPVAGICVLVFLFALLGAYRLGKMGRQETVPLAEVPVSNRSTPADLAQPIGEVPTPAEITLPMATPALDTTRPLKTRTERSGDNAILFASYKDRTQLEPLKNYFIQHGIQCEIRLGSFGFILVTVDRFEGDPVRPGTPGYALLQDIIRVGSGYQPPPTYLTFTRETFESARGIKLKD